MDIEMTRLGFRALGDPTRLHIVRFLSDCCCETVAVDEEGGVEGPTAGEVCCHITGADRISSTISHHLHELEQSGLVALNRRGKSTVCSLNRDHLAALAEELAKLARAEGDPRCCEQEETQ